MTHLLNFKPQPIQKLKRFQEFIFVSDSTLVGGTESARQLQLSPNSSWLNEVEIGNFVNVEQIYTPQNITSQLRNLKVQPNRKVQLVSRSETGSVVVNLNNKLIGIGAEIAQRIVVTFVSAGKE